MRTCILLPAMGLAALVASTASSEQNRLMANQPKPAGNVVQARANFQAEFPGAKFYELGNRIGRVYGAPFGSGNSPQDPAEQFRLNQAGIFGVESDDLDPRGPLTDERHTLPLGYDRETGEYKFTIVYYTQRKNGIPVFRSDVRLLVRNQEGYPLVLVSSGLRDLGTFSPDATPIRFRRARKAALEAAPGLVEFSDPQLVIWAGVDDEVVEPRLAVEFIGEVGSPVEPEIFQKWLFVVDAKTNAVLYQEDQILSVDVAGNVSGIATEDIGADTCEPESSIVMPWSRVNIGGTFVYTDENGDFVLPNAGNSPVTVESRVSGL